VNIAGYEKYLRNLITKNKVDSCGGEVLATTTHTTTINMGIA
jgi:hypothetical protein